jgi:hypothetical protein
LLFELPWSDQAIPAKFDEEAGKISRIVAKNGSCIPYSCVSCESNRLALQYLLIFVRQRLMSQAIILSIIAICSSFPGLSRICHGSSK